jgi:hypothetical protein
LDGYSFGFSLDCFKHNDTIRYIDNLDCNKCFCKAFVNIEKNRITKETITVSPNPVENTLNIHSNHTQIQRIEIFDIYGRLILSEKNCNLMHSIDVSNLASSIYVLKVYTDNSVLVNKFVKE